MNEEEGMGHEDDKLLYCDDKISHRAYMMRKFHVGVTSLSPTPYAMKKIVIRHGYEFGNCL